MMKQYPKRKSREAERYRRELERLLLLAIKHEVDHGGCALSWEIATETAEVLKRKRDA